MANATAPFQSPSLMRTTKQRRRQRRALQPCCSCSCNGKHTSSTFRSMVSCLSLQALFVVTILTLSLLPSTTSASFAVAPIIVTARPWLRTELYVSTTVPTGTSRHYVADVGLSPQEQLQAQLWISHTQQILQKQPFLLQRPTHISKPVPTLMRKEEQKQKQHKQKQREKIQAARTQTRDETIRTVTKRRDTALDDRWQEGVLFVQQGSNSHLQPQEQQYQAPTADEQQRRVVAEAAFAYQARKNAWAAKYTSVDALRRSFGSNHNVLWGDLDAGTARRLYKTLLPKALLELYRSVQVHPEDLAPLAYRARVAAKLYARERCVLPARIAANLYDGFRQWKRYGRFDACGMSYQQVWEKYAKTILEQECHHGGGGSSSTTTTTTTTMAVCDMAPEDVTAKICLKILERSCQTNEMIDRLVLPHAGGSHHHVLFSKEHDKDLLFITQQLEQDVRQLLQGGDSVPSSSSSSSLLSTASVPPFYANSKAATIQHRQHHHHQLTARKIRTLRALVRVKRRLERLHTNLQHSPAVTTQQQQHQSPTDSTSNIL